MPEKARKPLLFISTIATFCLFFTPSKIMLIFLATIFLIVAASVLHGTDTQKHNGTQYIKFISLCVTILMVFISCRSFVTTWLPSSKVSAMAAAFHMRKRLFLTFIAIMGGACGSYAMYFVSKFLVERVNEFISAKMLVRDKRSLYTNFRANWLFPLSAIAFFLLNASSSIPYLWGIFFAL